MDLNTKESNNDHHFIALIKSTLIDEEELCNFFRDKGYEAQLILGDYEVVLEFYGEYKELLKILRSKYVDEKIFKSKKTNRELMVIYQLKKELNKFKKNDNIKFYTFMNFEVKSEINVVKNRLDNENIKNAILLPVTNKIFLGKHNLIIKGEIKNISNLRKLLLKKIRGVFKTYNFKVRTSTHIVL